MEILWKLYTLYLLFYATDSKKIYVPGLSFFFCEIQLLFKLGCSYFKNKKKHKKSWIFHQQKSLFRVNACVFILNVMLLLYILLLLLVLKDVLLNQEALIWTYNLRQRVTTYFIKGMSYICRKKVNLKLLIMCSRQIKWL